MNGKKLLDCLQFQQYAIINQKISAIGGFNVDFLEFDRNRHFLANNESISCELMRKADPVGAFKQSRVEDSMNLVGAFENATGQVGVCIR